MKRPPKHYDYYLESRQSGTPLTEVMREAGFDQNQINSARNRTHIFERHRLDQLPKEEAQRERFIAQADARIGELQDQIDQGGCKDPEKVFKEIASLLDLKKKMQDDSGKPRA